jgi:hypothetical protein
MKSRVLGPAIALVILGVLSVVLPRLILTPPNPDLAGSCSITQFHAHFMEVHGPGSGTYARVSLTKTSSGTCTTSGWPGVTVPSSPHSFANIDMVAANFAVPPLVGTLAKPHLVQVHQGTTLEFFLHYPSPTGQHCVTSSAILVYLPGHPSTTQKISSPKVTSCEYLLDVTPIGLR